jgi:hypothetical protein
MGKVKARTLTSTTNKSIKPKGTKKWVI